jgi:hypothetical protein
MLSFTLQTNAQVPLSANVVDQLGGVAQAESIYWAIADESVASIDSTSGSTVTLIAQGEGSTTVAVTVGSLTTLLHVTVAPVVASSVSIEIGTPVAKAVILPPVVEQPVAEPHAGVAHPAETIADPAPVEAHAIEAHPEAPHAGEETGREAAQPAAPPAPVEATHGTPAAA